jgi:hypothetical protein
MISNTYRFPKGVCFIMSFFNRLRTGKRNPYTNPMDRIVHSGKTSGFPAPRETKKQRDRRETNEQTDQDMANNRRQKYSMMKWNDKHLTL